MCIQCKKKEVTKEHYPYCSLKCYGRALGVKNYEPIPNYGELDYFLGLVV